MNQCPFTAKIYHYDPLTKFGIHEMLRDIGYSELQCILPDGHVGKHVCRDGVEIIEYPNTQAPTEQGIILEWHRRKEAGESTDDLERVLGLDGRLKHLADALGVTGKAARKAIARELSRSATTDEPRKKRLIKI